MFDDLVSLFSGWYQSYVASIRDLLQTSHTIVNTLPDGTEIIDTVDVNPEIWSAYVPWEELFAIVFLAIFTISLFKLLRCVLCKIL